MTEKLTATEAGLQQDIRRNKARRNAAMFMTALRDFIPDNCKREAQYHLTDLFYANDVEITTEQSRRMVKL